jgi:hypothetical protein
VLKQGPEKRVLVGEPLVDAPAGKGEMADQRVHCSTRKQRAGLATLTKPTHVPYVFINDAPIGSHLCYLIGITCEL